VHLLVWSNLIGCSERLVTFDTDPNCFVPEQERITLSSAELLLKRAVLYRTSVDRLICHVKNKKAIVFKLDWSEGCLIDGKQTQWFDPSAFLLPTPGTFGNLGRGTYTGPGLAEVDMSVFKNIPLSERFRLQFRAEFFNLLNRANLGTPSANVFSGTSVSASAGLITTLATTPRQIQFGLKLTF